MIEHVSIPVSDYEKSKAFYAAALAPVGYELKADMAEYKAAGFMEGGHTSFWIGQKENITPIHVALGAKSKEEVQAFHEAMLKAGGTDNGGPGFRTDYGPNYYAAFAFDLDGNNIEACYFGENAP